MKTLKEKKWYFYNLNLPITYFMEDENLNYKIDGNNLELSYGTSYIKIINIDYASKDPIEFIIYDYNDISILKYLFKKYNIMFYDENYINEVRFLDENKYNIFYKHVLHEYIYNCMLHHGIIKNITELNKIYNEEFFSPSIVESALYLKLKNAKKEYRREVIREFFNKIKRIFKK